MTREEILDFFQAHKDEMQERFSVVKIGLFGSYAKDKATEKSDIDVYAEFQHKKYRNISGVWNYLEAHLDKKIDLFYKHKNMRKSLQENIEKEVIFG